jgi:ABC-type uncharacterized transport system permease subunit
VNVTALVTAILGAALGAMVTRDLMRGQRWTAASRAGMGGASLLFLVTIGNGTWLEHQVVSGVAIALMLASMAASGRARREKPRDVNGFLR